MVLAACLAVPGRAAFSAGMPPALPRFEEVIEDGYDHALAGKGASPHAIAEGIRAAWIPCRSALEKDSIDEAELSRQDSLLLVLANVAAGRPGALELARAVNAAGSLLDRFFDRYHPRSPATLLRLDYLGRELLLDGRMADFERTKRDRSLLVEAWTPFRPHVLAAGGRRPSLQFDESLATMDRGLTKRDARAVRQSALRILDLVDRMERLF